MQRGGGGGGMGRGRGRRDNDLIGQTVRISQGPYKGRSGDGSCLVCMFSTYGLPYQIGEKRIQSIIIQMGKNS